MKPHFLIAATSCLALSFGLTACNKKSDSEITGYVEFPASSFDQYFDIADSTGTKANAEQALDDLNIRSSLDETFTYNLSVADDGVVTISNLIAKELDGFKIDTIKISGLSVNDDLISFDRVELDTLSLVEPSESITMEIKTVDLIGPVTVPASEESFDPETFFSDGGSYFKGLKVEGLKFAMTAPETVAYEVDNILFGVKEQESKMDFRIDGVALSGSSQEVGKFSGHLDEAYIKGFDYSVYADLIKYFVAMESGIALGDDVTKLDPPNFTMFHKYFDTYGMKDGALAMDYFDLTFSKAYGSATQTGGIITQSSLMEPMTFRLLESPPEAEAEEIWAMFKKHGLDTMTLSSKSHQTMDKPNDRVVVDVAELNLNDDFKISATYDMSGVDKMYSQSFDAGLQGEAALNPMEIYKDLAINSLSLKISDKTMINKLYGLAADMQGASVEVVKTQAKGGFAMLPAMAQGENQKSMANEVAEKMSIFLDGGKALSLTIDPKTPLNMESLDALMADQLSKEDLGLTVSVE